MTDNARVFPKYLSIQTTSMCNAHCVFCPYDDIKDKFGRAVMPDILFKKIIDECSLHTEVERIILYLNNEPLTDPRIAERIAYAKERAPWANAHILTNGSLLTDTLAQRLVDSKLDWIGISLHGIEKETIEKAMGINYELTLKRVLNFIDKAKLKRNIKDFIMLTFLGHEYLSPQEKEKAVNFWKEKGIERISYFDAPVSRAGNVKSLPQVKNRELKGCASIWVNEMIHIAENGDALLCCMDWNREIVLGNICQQSIREVWNSQRYQKIRDKRDGKIKSEEGFICKRCEAAIPGDHVKPSDDMAPGGPDIILVLPPPWGFDYPALGVASLSAYLRSKNFKTEIFDFNIYLYNKLKGHRHLWEMGSALYWRDEAAFAALLSSILDQEITCCAAKIISVRAKVVGFSVLSDSQHLITAEIIKRVRTRDPNIKIVLGGTSISIDEQREYFERNLPEYIDAYVVGQGEEILHDIVKAYKTGESIDDICGVVVHKAGRHTYAPRPPKDTLDSLPFPTFEEFHLDLYANKGDSLAMEWSRGCIARCIFCAFKVISAGFTKRSPEAIIKAIRYYKNAYGTRHLSLVDSAINSDLAHLKEVCDLLIISQLDVEFSALAIPVKNMQKELIDAMAKAGFRRIEYGVESGSDKILKAMNKIFTTKDAECVIRLTHEAGVKTVIYLIVGFPGEKEDEFNETMEFLRRNARHIDLVKSVNPLYLMAGSLLYSNIEKYGIKLPAQNPDFKWWIDSENNYAVRTKRVNAARALLEELGVNYFSEDNQFERSPAAAPDSFLCADHKEKAEVLLVTLPPWGVENPPLGLGYLDAYARNRGLKSKVIDFNISFYNAVDKDYRMLWHVENKNYWSNEKTFPALCELFEIQIDHAVEEILAYDAKLIGFSVVDPKERITIEVIKRIKKASAGTKVILGGPACSTQEQRDFFADRIPGYVDYFVIGEGEETLYEIVQRERQGLDSKALAGVAYKNNGGWRCLERQPVEPLDSIPFPTYEGFDSTQYNGGKSFLVAWSRGCLGKCSFCKNYRLSGGYRSRSPQHIFEELEFLSSRYGTQEVTVSDNLMNGDLKQLHGICDLLIKSGLGIRWSGQIAPRRDMDYDLFFKMRRAGCYKIQIGLESGSDKVLRMMKKIYTSETAQDNIKQAKKAGIETEIFILVGFPGETDKDFSKTRNFIRNNAPYINAIKSINTLHLIAGTEVYEEYRKFGLKDLPSHDWHYLWQARDGNDYGTRKLRAQRLVDLAYDLRLRVMETNIMEGKEALLPDSRNEAPAGQLKIIRDAINRIQKLPHFSIKPEIPRINHAFFQFILAALLFMYTLCYVSYFWIYKKLKGRALLGGE